MSAIGFLAPLPSTASPHLGRVSPSEQTVEFPMTTRSYNLGATPTRDEIIAMISELRGHIPTSERTDIERDSRLEVTRMLRTDLIAPLIGRVVSRWETCRKTGVEFSWAPTLPRSVIKLTLKKVEGSAADLDPTTAKGKVLWANYLWRTYQEPRVREMVLRYLVRQELAPK